MFFAANMSRAASCQNHAARCLALAREARDPEARSLFVEMAVCWRELADMIARNCDREDKVTGASSKKSKLSTNKDAEPTATVVANSSRK